MRIGFLAMKAGTTAGGLATYERHLLQGLAAVDAENDYQVFCVDPVEPEACGVTAPNFTFHRLTPRSRLRSMLWSAPRAIRAAEVDLFHAPFLPLLRPPAPFVFTAHGSEMFVHPDFFPAPIRGPLQALTKHGYLGAAEVLCVSGTMHEFLIERFPRTRGRSRVVYNGCDEAFRPIDPDAARATVRERHGIEGPYVLVVGRVEPRKNPVRILEAYARFAAGAGRGVRLALAGSNTWSAGEAADTIARLGIAPNVTMLGFIEHTRLPELYAAAEMFLFPSLWEGFGLPAIEAMRCGTPVITSTTSCMPEVAAGAALLVDPTSVDAIAGAMTRLHTEPDLRVSLRERGFIRGREFSWERCARETLAAYREVWSRTRGAHQ